MPRKSKITCKNRQWKENKRFWDYEWCTLKMLGVFFRRLIFALISVVWLSTSMSFEDWWSMEGSLGNSFGRLDCCRKYLITVLWLFSPGLISECLIVLLSSCSRLYLLALDRNCEERCTLNERTIINHIGNFNNMVQNVFLIIFTK